jgi:NUMOD4 motif/HNH endonuclease
MHHTVVTSEHWRPIPDYKGLYEISTHGRVRSLARPRTPGKVLSPGTDGSGYRKVALCKQGKQWDVRVHVLMVRTFHGEPRPGYHIRHLDGDKLNNRLDNLAASPPSLNTLDMVRHGRHNHARKTECKHGHSLTDPANVKVHKGRPRARICITCERARRRNCAARRRAQHAG